jgi:hypothetical protein
MEGILICFVLDHFIENQGFSEVNLTSWQPKLFINWRKAIAACSFKFEPTFSRAHLYWF